MGQKQFDNNYIQDKIKELSEKTVINYDELPKYDLFLSQVTDFLNDKFEDEKYTNNIIQNYIKSEIISKPEGGKKRGYTKQHLAQLILLSNMRPVLTMEETKKVFNLAFNDINDREDDIIPWEDAFKTFSNMQGKVFNDYLENGMFDDNKIMESMKQYNLKEKDEERIFVFTVVMTLIAQASAIKKLAKTIVEEYNENIED